MQTNCPSIFELAFRKGATLFSSGYGDGYYASYIGYDKDDEIVRLLTDFYVVDWMHLDD